MVFKKYFVVGLLLIAGCATPDQQVTSLRGKTKELEKNLEQKDEKIKELNKEIQNIQQERNYYSTRASVLEKEKAARVQEAEVIRKGVREFTDQVVGSLNTYFQRAEIVDYVGGEIISRKSLADDKNVLLIDTAHPLAANGTVIGGRAFITVPSRLQYCLIRRSSDGENGEIVAMSKEIVADKGGVQSWTFDVPMAAKQGDLIGLYMDSCSVPYDEVDTGDVRALKGTVKLNASVPLGEPKEKNKRAYSFGIVGYFDTKK